METIIHNEDSNDEFVKNDSEWISPTSEEIIVMSRHISECSRGKVKKPLNQNEEFDKGVNEMFTKDEKATEYAKIVTSKQRIQKPDGTIETKSINAESQSERPNTTEKKISETSREGDFVKFVKFVMPQFEAGIDRKELLVATPFLPPEVFTLLPIGLRESVNFYDPSKRERDVFLTGAIGVLSGCFPKVTGIYYRNKVNANLNAFISAPSASGKGVLPNALKLCGYIHNLKRKEGKDIAEKYKLNLGKSDTNKGEVPYLPEKLLVIPGNSSYSSIIKLLNDNDGIGIICETEADTLNNVMKQDWGNYSEMIRNATHHESIRQSRLSTGYVEIKKPKLSVVLSGTPGQLMKFIPSTEDGLFSRFLYYIYSLEPDWNDPSPRENSLSSEEYFRPIAQTILEVYKFYIIDDWKFCLTNSQWDSLNRKFERYTKEVPIFIGEDVMSVVFRYGLFQYRMAMLLSILRNFERHNETKVITCEDTDFYIASCLMDVFLVHSFAAYQLIPKRELVGFNGGVKEFYDNLPVNEIFTRKDAVEIGIKLKFSDDSTDKYLRKLHDLKLLKSPRYGSYIKEKNLKQ